ncbi:hypothetical protein [Streptomyces luteolus]|uniref:Uncharacterized protein n=1 Tax=Streptomyces luteolus TaxID=3043615 RepID=A0ABT6T841_9ACTN|nr:hypothetical protein [Streptomyces sp. B-S-A12]MDI3423781.1 hypothetical protein [Streptomyces sp. B-S-A12]
MPGPGLVRAAADAGLDFWAVTDPRLGPPEPLVKAGIPHQRLVSADFGEVSALRTLLTALARQHDVRHVLSLAGDSGSALAAGAATTARAVHRALFPEREAAASRLPDPSALRRLIGRSGAPVDGPGPVFGVRTLTVDGMHLVADITAAGPAARPPTESQRSVIRQAVRDLLDLVGYESGAARTDVLLTARGARVVASRELGHG